MPDYQGIGLGIKFLEFIAEYYFKKGYIFGITTSAKNLCFALKKNKNWLTIAIGKQSRKKQNNNYNNYNKTSSSERNTMSFKYNRKE